MAENSRSRAHRRRLACPLTIIHSREADQRMARVRRLSNGQSAELVGVAQPIVRCGEPGGEGRRGLFGRFPVPVSTSTATRSSSVTPKVAHRTELFRAHWP